MPALDGLRGVAVAGVLAFHGGYLAGGFLGVDLFFVLSGFLITSLLLVEREAGRISLWGFWSRRARRLLPAQMLVLVGVAVYAGSLAAPTELARIRGDGFATLFYYANWHAVLAERSYWDLFSTPSPLAHTWSLAIEEQFYIVWPLVLVLVLHGVRGTRRVLTLSVAVAIASAIWLAQVHEPGEGSRAYYGTDTRACALALGAALAAWMHARDRRPHAVARGLAWPAIIVLAALWSGLGGADPVLYRGGLLASQLAVVIVLACVSTGQSTLATALSWAPLRWVGRISYGLYLWHWPVFVVMNEARVGLDGIALFGLRSAISIGLAAATYYGLERPLRRGSFPGWKGATLAAFSFVAVAVALLLATVPRGPQPRPERTWLMADAAADNRADPIRLLIAGDSVASRLAKVMGPMGELGATIVDGGHPGCGLVKGHSRLKLPDGELIRLFACEDSEDRWTGLSTDVALLALTPPSHGTYLLGGHWRHACTESFDGAFEAEAIRAIKALEQVAPRVYVTTMPYVRRASHGAVEDDGTDCLNRRLRAAAAARGAQIIDLNAYVCPDGRCSTHMHDVLLRHDGLHFEGEGARIIGWWLVGQIRGRA